MEIRKTKGEFMLLPLFNSDNWFMPELNMYQKVYTIGWLMWFVRWTSISKYLLHLKFGSYNYD